MGLHFNFPEGQLEDPTTREHLNRVWWTSYILEHTCAAISSQTVSVPDDEIFTNFPVPMESNVQPTPDFEYTDCFIARIQLARVSRRIIKALYGRSAQKDPFLQRVQHSLRDLKQWLDNLPPRLQMTSQLSQSVQDPVQSLHLTFNQVNYTQAHARTQILSTCYFLHDSLFFEVNPGLVHDSCHTTSAPPYAADVQRIHREHACNLREARVRDCSNRERSLHPLR
jgi:hypothetical protein